MSLGLSKINLVKTIDPRIDIEKLAKHMYAIENTAIQNTYQRFRVSNPSVTNIAAVCNPPNRNVMVDPLFFLLMKFRLTFAGTSGGAGITLLQAAGLPVEPTVLPTPPIDPGNQYYDAPRAFPLSNAISNVQVTMNNDNNSTNLNTYFRALTRYMNSPQCQDSYESYTPSMLDQFLEYSQGIGFNRSELRGYGDNVLQCPRGGYINAVIQQNDSTGTNADRAIVDLEVMEPLYLSPLSHGCQFKRPSFLQLDTITVNVNLGGRGNTPLGGLGGALWSHAEAPVADLPAAITSISTEILSAEFLFHYMTPPLSMQLPKQVAYPYTQPIYYSTVFGAIEAGQQDMINLNNVQLNSIPQKVYLWAAVQDTDVDFTNTDTYLEIDNVSVQFNNAVGILSTATQRDLYNIAVRNGFNGSWRQFSHDVGSVLCLQFGEDIHLSSDILAAGTRGSYNFSAQVRCRNNYSEEKNVVLSALFIHEGVFIIDAGQAYREIGILTQNEVLETKKSPEPAMDQPEIMSAAGGFSWDQFLNFFKKGARAALNVGKAVVPHIAPQYAPAVEAADVLARTVGIGRRRKAATRSKAKGGRKLSVRQLKALY